MDHKRESGGWSSTINQDINTSRNFKITAQIKKQSGILNNGYGLTFGKKDNNNQNHFLISADGSFKIVQYKTVQEPISKIGKNPVLSRQATVFITI